MGYIKIKKKRYKNVLFEAWLIGGVTVKLGEDEYSVLTREDAVKKIDELLREGRYDVIKELADQLSNPPQFSDKLIKKSVRVPFSVYCKLVDAAFRENIALKDIVKRVVLSELQGVHNELLKRNDIQPEKMRIFSESMTSWLESEDEELGVESFTPVRIGGFWLKKDLIETVWEIGKKSFLADSEYSEIAERFWENVNEEWSIKEYTNEFAEMTGLRLMKGERGSLELVLDTTLLVLPELKGDEAAAVKEQLEEEFGYSDVKKFMDKWIMYEEEVMHPRAIDVEIARLKMEFKDSEFLINGWGEAALLNEKPEDLAEAYLSKEEHLEVEELENRVKKLSREGDFEKVAEIAGKLDEIKTRKTIVAYAFLTVRDLLKGKTQVVSFSAPEIVVRAWEAYGDTTLSRVFDVEV